VSGRLIPDLLSICQQRQMAAFFSLPLILAGIQAGPSATWSDPAESGHLKSSSNQPATGPRYVAFVTACLGNSQHAAGSRPVRFSQSSDLNLNLRDRSLVEQSSTGAARKDYSASGSTVDWTASTD